MNRVLRAQRLLQILTRPAWGGKVGSAIAAPILFDDLLGSGAITDHTPDLAPVGSSWAIGAGTFGDLSGGIFSSSSTNARVVIDCGLADYELRWRSKFTDAKASISSGVCFRCNSDASQRYTAGLGDDSGEHHVYWNLPNSFIVCDDQTVAWSNPETLVNGEYYTWKVLVKGNSVRLYDVDGTLKMAAEGAAYPTNTYVGFYTEQNAGTWDWIDVRPISATFEYISIMGDSISDGAGEWPYLVAVNRKNGYCQLKNHAQSGSTIMAQMDGQTDASEADNANFTMIALGTNDGDNVAVHAEYEENLLELWGTLHKPIYAMGILPISGDQTARDNNNTRISAAVADAVSAGANVTYWNTDGWIDPATDTGDGLHPNAAGHIKIKNEVLARLP
jgi:GDSL-like Lipase/Acylhydrolase family